MSSHQAEETHTHTHTHIMNAALKKPLGFHCILHTNPWLSVKLQFTEAAEPHSASDQYIIYRICPKQQDSGREPVDALTAFILLCFRAFVVLRQCAETSFSQADIIWPHNSNIMCWHWYSPMSTLHDNALFSTQQSVLYYCTSHK